MAIQEIKDMHIIVPFYAGQNDTMILSCLQGHAGCAYADDSKNPTSVILDVAGFCYPGGKPNDEMLEMLSGFEGFEWYILAPPDDAWREAMLRVYGERLIPWTRYAIKKEPGVFDRAYLQGIVDGLDAEYTLKMIDRKLYEMILQTPWAYDWCSNFATYEDFEAHGIGVVAMHGEEIVSGASTYIYFDGGIEIQIDTRDDYRRRGLALACAAKLILACLEKGLYPAWDAHNRESVALAEKLGYHMDHPYEVFLIGPEE